MGKTKKSDFEEEMHSKTPSKSKSEFVFSDSDDDAEANADLSLKIVEKSKSRASSDARRSRGDGVAEGELQVGGEGDDIVTTEFVALDSVKKKSKREKKNKKAKRIETEAQTDNAVPERQNTETIDWIEGLEVFKSSEQDGVNNSNNPVLQQLLRPPRYFTLSDSSFGTCYNCGEEGHMAVNCKIAKRKKPCFICGSFEHGAKECQKGKDCFICNKSGHRARDCPKKFKKCSQGSDLCLKCGSSGHVMSSCNNDYSLDDLKEIQCYVCKSFGHLCCGNYFETVPTEVSCYKCGQLGHTGLACRGAHGERAGEATPSSCFKCGEEGHFARECSNSYKAYRGTNGEMAGGYDTPSSCYKCGEEGHFARECSNSYNVKKRSHDLSTPKRKATKEKAYKGYKSAPQENGKTHKKKKLNFDEENSRSSSKWKPWTGWTTDDPADFPRGRVASSAGWDSHSTPNGKGHHNYRTSGSGRYASTSRSPKRFNSSYSRTPNPQSSRHYIQHGYSAQRFDYPNSAEPRRRNNDRWL